MSFTLRSQVPVHYEILYAKDRPLIEEEYQPYLLTLQTQGVTWEFLKSIAEEYITTNKLSFDTNPGGPSLEKPCYFYAHTISEFNGTTLKSPIVIYVGISKREKVSPKTFISKFRRACDKSESGRNLLWHGAVDTSGGHEIHILPIRLEGKSCNEIEIYFMDILGRFCIPKPYQGPLVNVGRDSQDPHERSEFGLQHYEENPHLKGEGGVISIRQKARWTDDNSRNEWAEERRQRYLTLTEEQQENQVEPLKEYRKNFNKWKKTFLKKFAHKEYSLFKDFKDKNLEITANYTKQLKTIQESGYFRRTIRRDYVKTSATKIYGMNLVFPEYRKKQIEAYLNATNLGLDEVGKDEAIVFEQCNGYWYPCNQELIKQYKRENSGSCENGVISYLKIPSEFRKPKVFKKVASWIPSISGQAATLPSRSSSTKESIDNTESFASAAATEGVAFDCKNHTFYSNAARSEPEVSEKGKLLNDAIAHIKEPESYDEWVMEVLEPYKHKFDYTSLSYNQPLTDFDYLQKFEEIKKRTDIFATFTNASSLNKRGGIEYDLIYLENNAKIGPCWGPSKKLLKKLYKDEIARINQEKWEAVEKANLATKEPKKKHEEITLEDLHEWVTSQCKDLTPEQKFTAFDLWKPVESSPRSINRWRNVALKYKKQWYSVDKKKALALIKEYNRAA